ncbi:alpha-glucosidase [Nigerium sp.]|uniref:glycoside hydrolase family 13 protein n=1 Tax=Nigerium sp. TaxID=2042655 RepID=UPI003221DCFC
MATATPWWKSAVVYQVYPRSFADSDGDGVGDLRGIISKIDYLATLGVDVVWLSPIYASPMDDNGYDIADYQAVDPLFGTLEDLDELILGLHNKGIKLVMDLVVNHTSDEHAWFKESRDPASAKRDWYYWRPAREGKTPGEPGAEPTNWGSFFSGPAWTYDEASGEYFLHLFSRRQPDLNWENPEVRQAIYAMMRWWVDRGVDGFRMDVINLISKTLPLADGPESPGMGLSYDVSLVSNGPRMIEFLEEMNREVGISERGLFTVGEMINVTADQAREYTSQFHDRLGMVFTFEHVSVDQEPGGMKWQLKPLHLPDLKKTMAAWQEGLADEGWNSLYFCNHDQPRVVSRFGDDSPEHRATAAKTIATVLHLHKGTPFVYQGEELGMTNAGFRRLEDYRDIESINFAAMAAGLGFPAEQVLAALASKSRDNARTPMPWTPEGGFTSGEPWLAMNHTTGAINAETELYDRSSVFYYFRRLIQLRHHRAVIREGRFELLLPEDPRIWAFTRTLKDEQLLVVANMTSHVAGVPVAELPSLERAEMLLSTNSNPRDIQALEPWESKVLLLRR